MTRATMVAAAAALAIASSDVQAGTITVSDSVAATATNWTQTLTVDQFDDQGGALLLESVAIQIVGSVEASASAENRSISQASPRLVLDASLTVTKGGMTLFSMSPSIDMTADLAAFDGSIDFDGPSGDSFGLTDSVSESIVWSIPADDLSAFIGTGLLSFDATALATSFAETSGAAIAMFRTTMGVTLSVTYDFRGEPAIAPLPTPAGLAGLGLAGLAFRRQRRA